MSPPAIFTHTHPWAYEKGSYDNFAPTILDIDWERLTAMVNRLRVKYN